MRLDPISRCIVPLSGSWERRYRDLSRRATGYIDRRRGLTVISALEDTTEDGKDVEAWHVSVGAASRSPTNDEMEHVIKSFALVWWEEDNHLPGLVRNLWVPVEEEARHECPCKLDEPQAMTMDGLAYSIVPGVCSGCEVGAMRADRPCQVHETVGRPLEWRSPAEAGAAANG